MEKGGDGKPDSGADIDNIIDNMFVRRPPIQPSAANAIMKAGDPNLVVDGVKVSSFQIFVYF